MILTIIPTSAAAAVPDSKLFFTETVDEAVFADWFDNWEKTDKNNLDSADTWCRTNHTVYGGTHAAYCAKSGYNSHYWNGTNQPYDFNLLDQAAGLPQSQYTQRYDTNMDAVMRRAVGGLSAYSVNTLSFYFHSDTGVSDAKQPDTGTTVGYDFLNVIYYTGTNSSLVKHVAWTDTQEQATSKSWIHATVTIPNNATWVGFEFVSGTTPPTNGDASDAFTGKGVSVINGDRGMREGVYLDTITLTGTVPVGSLPLTTTVNELDAYQNSSSFTVSYTYNHPKVAMDHYKLYYRVNGTGEWNMYTTAQEQDGTFEPGPVTFVAPYDGTYEFFTQGTDVSAYSETRRDAADTSTIVDTVSPVTTAAVFGEKDGSKYTGAAAVNLTSTDATSGVEKILYRVDGGSWSAYTENIGLSTTGTHVVEFYSVDRAGNAEGVKNVSLTITTGSPGIVFQEPDDSYPEGNVTIGFTVVNGATISKLEYSLDGAAFVEVPVNSTSVSLTGLSDGEHKLIVKATDVSGESMEKEVSFKVGSSGTDILGTIAKNPMVIGGILAAVLAVIAGAVLLARRKK